MRLVREFSIGCLVLGLICIQADALADEAAGIAAFDLGDFATAFREWSVSAKQGDALAQFHLGRLYEAGQGTLQDYVSAHAWYNIAAAAGNADAQMARDALAARMSPGQVAEAQQMARHLLAENPPSTATPGIDTAGTILDAATTVKGLGDAVPSPSLSAANPATKAPSSASVAGSSQGLGQASSATDQIQSGTAVAQQASEQGGVVDSVSSLFSTASPPPAPTPPPPAPQPPPPPAAAAMSPGGFRDCRDCPEMVTVAAGNFVMGAQDGDTDERPIHPVRISAPLSVSRAKITFAEWDACVAEGGCPPGRSDGGWGRGAMPVFNVSWLDARAYIEWLVRKTGKGYRLPSEGEWEYFARGGTAQRYWWGDIPAAKANCRGCGPGLGNQPVPAGSLPANPFGLSEILGNLSEWVADCATDDYRAAPMDGSVLSGGDCSLRMARGGSWQMGPSFIRVTTRFRLDPSYQSNQVGFRVVRAADSAH